MGKGVKKDEAIQVLPFPILYIQHPTLIAQHKLSSCIHSPHRAFPGKGHTLKVHRGGERSISVCLLLPFCFMLSSRGTNSPVSHQ